MFPCYEQKLKWDDYGEIVRPEDWADAKPDEEKVNGKRSFDDDVIDSQLLCKSGVDPVNKFLRKI